METQEPGEKSRINDVYDTVKYKSSKISISYIITRTRVYQTPHILDFSLSNTYVWHDITKTIYRYNIFILG